MPVRCLSGYAKKVVGCEWNSKERSVLEIII